MARIKSADKPGSPSTEGGGPAMRVLKKYPNRRLYDTQSSSYITLADVKQMVLDGAPFEVRDAKSGDDLTRSILLQIILEEESGGVPMFSTDTLAQIIRLYGHAMQGAMGSWFEQNMKAFADMQGRVLGGAAVPPVPNLMGAYFEQSQKLFAQMQEQAGSIFPGFVPPTKK
jgi:polyhydroxyalkanoate synthesis repressor PhaR